MALVMREQPVEKGDPRWLRAMMDRSAELSREHGVASVFVGLAGREGDLLVADFLAFVESALRVEDAIFPITRERAVLLLADVDRARAEEIIERLRRDFAERFPTAEPLRADVRYLAIAAGNGRPTAKDVLPEIFRR